MKKLINIALIRRSSWGFTAASLRTFGGWVVHKLFAVFLGTEGVSLLSHLQNFFSLFTQPLTDGTHKALIRLLSGNEDKQHHNFSLGAINSGIWFWNFAFVGLLSLLIFGFYIQWLDVFEWSWPFWAFIMSAVLALVFQSFIQSILLAHKLLKAFALLTALSVIAMVAIVLFGVLDNGIDSALMYYALSQLALALSFAIYAFYKKMYLPWQWKLDAQISRYLLSFMLMAGSVWLFTKLTDFVVRDYAFDFFGLAETGLWQACDRLSQGYRGLYIATLSAVFYPQISDLLNNRNALRPYLFSVYKHIFIFGSVFFIALFYFREEVLILFYAKQFAEAADLFSWQIAGDILAFLAFPLSLVLMAKVKTAYFIALQAVSALVYIMVIFFFKEMGVEVFVISWTVRQCVYLVINLVVNRKILIHA